MKNALITLLSDQVVPSTSFIATLAQKEDFIFIITTQKMKEKQKIVNLSDSLHGAYSINEIIIENEDSISEISTHLDAIKWQDFDTVYIDLTLGTKLMALAVHAYFRRFDELYAKPQVHFYYQPVGKNCIRKIDATDLVHPRLLSLNDYLTANGISVINKQNECIAGKEVTKIIMQQYPEYWTDAGKLFRRLRNAKKPKLSTEKAISLLDLDKDSILLSNGSQWRPLPEELDLIYKFCTIAQFSLECITKRHIDYLSGGWLEEWFYNKVIETMPDLVPSQVALNLHIRTATAAENELDVALVNSRNAFRYAECKTSLESDESGASLLIEILYKQAAIRKNFGLTSSALLVTVDKITKSSSLGRARDLDLKIIDHDILYNEYDLRRELVAHLA